MLSIRKKVRKSVFFIPFLILGMLAFLMQPLETANASDPICMVGGGQNCEHHTFSCGADICDNGPWTRLCIVCVNLE